MTISNIINQALEKDGIAILLPMDVFKSISVLKKAKIRIDCTILDPWYNKGFGGELPLKEYGKFIKKLINQTAKISNLIYLWGLPEIVGPYVRFVPTDFKITWLTWYCKNCPTVTKGWRSSQNACLQFMHKKTQITS